MGNMGSGRVYSLAAFVISLIIGALYFFEQYLLDHHEYLRIIEQSLRVCESWTCYRDANLVSHMKGYMWVRYVFSSLMGSQLKGAWLSLSFFFALFVSASFFIAYEKTKSVLSSLGFIFLLLLSWPLLQYEVLVGEDNLSYYGLFLWFLYFYYVNRKMMIAGALLGTMIFVHESPIAFLGLGASIPFYFFYERSKVKEHVVFIVASLVSFHLLFIPAYWDVLISKPIDLIFEYNPIQMHLSDAL
jgi:hypothetical protein